MSPLVIPPTPSATINPHVIRYLVKDAERRGISLERPLREAGLTPDVLDAPSLRVSFRQGSAVIDAALRLFDDPAAGLVVGGSQPITASGVLGLGMMSSPRIVDAIHLGLRFQNLAGSMVRWSTSTRGDLLSVTAEVTGGEERVSAFLIDEGFANITRMARDVTGSGFHPVRVELARPAPTDAARYGRWFGAPVEFGAARNAWTLSEEQWRLPSPFADAWTLRGALALLEEESAGVVDRQELVAVLAARIDADLPEIAPLGAHARALALSERTLRRRLTDVQATYSALVDDVRRRAVTRMLTQGALSVNDVAAAAGYGDDRSLRRATRRWFGCSPATMRERLQSGH
ncbi:AraC family transcriptional regulator [Microbacterium sp. SSW1-49]|uniref:AraC family transcriptional regulator n=1 Tax=Microbacterium croceum TaxID=2851645 RepID=A0ABT0FB65_9MICO|nr:AraC family transcriptional regulator [Microbacterium croceum]MCK2035303.1 AraC family transcriptional regulator [Microbacterium croceum]